MSSAGDPDTPQASDASVQAARAAYLPRLSLTAALGSATADLSPEPRNRFARRQHEESAMLFRQLWEAETSTYTYLLADEATKEAVLIDPVRETVERYARDANPRQRALFEASLRAALTEAEIAELASTLGFRHVDVRMTSDRHWTLVAS